MENAKVNVHPVERIVSAGLGGALLLRNLGKGSFGGMALAIPFLYRGFSGHSFLYQVLDISTLSREKQQQIELAEAASGVERSITIGKSADELYHLWRSLPTLAKVMGDAVEITEVSPDHTRCLVHQPFARTLEWDTRIVEDRPGSILRWKSLQSGKVASEGSVSFRPAPKDWGTEMTLRLRFTPPGGRFGKMVSKRLGFVPGLFLEKVLRRFKSLAETGEVPTLEHNPSARVIARAS